MIAFQRKANWVRRAVLEMGVRGRSGHVTTAFSLAELFVALYHGKILRFDPARPRWEERDRFILSEGQAGIGLYPVLADVGFFPISELGNFLGKGSVLGVHAESRTPGIEVLTGSLGHGLPIATGLADAAKIDGEHWLTMCLVGDGELCEGSNYEAMLMAGSLKLGNLVVVVNRNRQFAIGFTDRRETQRDVVLDPLPKKFEAFGFESRVVDGHSFPDIFRGFGDLRTRSADKPLVIIADTVKGKGSRELEHKRGWHYKVPRGETLEAVRAELEQERTALEGGAI